MDDYTEMTIETYLTERLTKEIAAYEKKKSLSPCVVYCF